MALEAYRDAVAEFKAARADLTDAADALSRLSALLREHPMRVRKTNGDLQIVARLGDVLSRFEEARDAARAAFLEVPREVRDDVEPPP